MFEMAAFLHSREPGKKSKLVVCPIFVGPAFLLGHAGLTVILMIWEAAILPPFPGNAAVICALAFPCFSLLAYVILAHGRSIETMQGQVRDFNLSQARSFCCEVDHITSTGSRLVCDRRVIGQCITCWFGSEAHFENVIRTTVLQTLVHQLATRTFTYGRILQGTSPMLLLASQKSAFMSIGCTNILGWPYWPCW